jgi:hypothetical protein
VLGSPTGWNEGAHGRASYYYSRHQMLKASKRLGAGQFDAALHKQGRHATVRPRTSSPWSGIMAWKSIKCIGGAQHPECLLHNSSRSHQAASLSTGIVILPASLLRHMADSGHPPREATPLDQRPAPPRAKKTRGAEKHRRVQILILVRTRFFD